MNTKQFLSQCFRDLGQMLFPRFCPICGKALMHNDKCICMECYMKLHFLPQSSSAKEWLEADTSKQFWGVLPIERATSFIQYKHESISHQLLVDLKYRHYPQIGVDMGEMMAKRLLPTGFFDGVDAIIPVPLHWTRHLHRGYNQSERLAKGISNITHIPVVDNAIKRARGNKTQTHLDKTAREKNVANLFVVKSIRKLRGKHLLLVDDVMTSGATLKSLGKTICEADETIRLSILTLARAHL